ncbi:hypothetical protein GCM10009603_11810 [Nocardiopsis exhalans]
MTAAEGARMRRDEALDALEEAGVMRARVRTMGRWYLTFSSVFAAAAVVLLLTLGFLPDTPAAVVVGVLFGLTVLTLLVWSATRPVTPHRFAWIHGFAMLGWGAVYGVVLLAGNQYFPGVPAWWAVGALLSAVPPLVAGYLTVRGSRSTR